MPVDGDTPGGHWSGQHGISGNTELQDDKKGLYVQEDKAAGDSQEVRVGLVGTP